MTPLADRRAELVAQLCAIYHDATVDTLEALARELIAIEPARLRPALLAMSSELHPSAAKIRRALCERCQGVGRVAAPRMVELANGQIVRGHFASDCPECLNGRRMPGGHDAQQSTTPGETAA